MGWERGVRKSRKLDNVTIVLIISAQIIGYESQWPREVATYLETHFDDYDLLAIELQTHAYRFFGSKKFLRYRHLQQVNGDNYTAAMQAALPRLTRPFVYVLSMTDRSSVEDFYASFDRIRSGAMATEILMNRSQLENDYSDILGENSKSMR